MYTDERGAWQALCNWLACFELKTTIAVQGFLYRRNLEFNTVKAWHNGGKWLQAFSPD